MENEELKYYVGFSLIPGVGSARGNRLINFFDSMKNAWGATQSDLARAGIEENIIDEIVKLRKELDLDYEMEKIRKEGINLLTIKDKNYPKMLKEIYNPPYLLYIKGGIRAEDEFSFAIVGARRASDYGKQVTHDIAGSLAENKITVVSGLALGIDSVAHQAALEVGGGRTIAVLGCGLDEATIYPKENRALVKKIIEGRGAVISEYPLGTPPLKQNFPSRNRIISGLSQGVLVVEATAISGSLITAGCALEQGRDVFAIPGSIYNKNTAGPHSLIKKGAKLVENIDDILEELHLSSVVEKIEASRILPENENEEVVMKILELEARHIDEVSRQSGIQISDLNALLVTMEMKGMVRNMGGGNYIVKR